ncbi:hypothetical protein [Trinickia mobilis]|uniref:hypothetical protein n=1 Tax=Trinickia mobilis TaxID=2816356 RepID=UPI001A8D1232|nr:hypothetical protein [Trinickia mobilis]
MVQSALPPRVTRLQSRLAGYPQYRIATTNEAKLPSEALAATLPSSHRLRVTFETG